MLEQFNLSNAKMVRERTYKHKGYKYTFEYEGNVITVYTWLDKQLNIRGEIRVGEGTIFNGIASPEFIDSFRVLRDIAGAQYIRYKGGIDTYAKQWFANLTHEDKVSVQISDDGSESAVFVDMKDDDTPQH